MNLANWLLFAIGLTGAACAGMLESQMRSDVKEKDPSLVLNYRSSTQVYREHARLFPESSKRKLVFACYAFFFLGFGLLGFGVFK